jgi:hypothetical protein
VVVAAAVAAAAVAAAAVAAAAVAAAAAAAVETISSINFLSQQQIGEINDI